jgi:hypothetical protein
MASEKRITIRCNSVPTATQASKCSIQDQATKGSLAEKPRSVLPASSAGPPLLCSHSCLIQQPSKLDRASCVKLNANGMEEKRNREAREKPDPRGIPSQSSTPGRVCQTRDVGHLVCAPVFGLGALPSCPGGSPRSGEAHRFSLRSAHVKSPRKPSRSPHAKFGIYTARPFHLT